MKPHAFHPFQDVLISSPQLQSHSDPIFSQNTTTSNTPEISSKPTEPAKTPSKKTRNVLVKTLGILHGNLFKSDPLLHSLWPLFCLFTSIMIGYLFPFMKILNNPLQHPLRIKSIGFALLTILIFPGSAYSSLFLAMRRKSLFFSKLAVFLMIINALFSIPFSMVNLKQNSIETEDRPIEVFLPLVGLLICYHIITTFSMINHAFQLKKMCMNPSVRVLTTVTTTQGNDFSMEEDQIDLEEKPKTLTAVKTEINEENSRDVMFIKRKIKHIQRSLKTFKNWGLYWIFISFAYSITSIVPFVMMESWNSQKGEAQSDLLGLFLMFVIVFIVGFQIYVHKVLYLAVRDKNLAKAREAISVLKFNAWLCIPVGIVNSVLIMMNEKELFKKQVLFLQVNHHSYMALVNYQMIRSVEKVLEEAEALACCC